MESYNSRLSTLLFMITLISSSNDLCSAARTTSTKFIKTSCSATAYPSLCYSSLASHASAIQQSPKLLADTALALSLNTARSTAVDMVKFSRDNGMTPREVAAIRDCIEVMGDTVDRLSRSMVDMKQIKSSNFEGMMSDIQTWVSAALTDEDTCTDGFAGKSKINGGVKAILRSRILKVAHMTSNALALINGYAALHG